MLSQLAGWIKESKYTVVFTGAGMSTESGVPDFRSKEGLWKNIDPRTVATIDALEENYPLFHEFYSMRIRALEECKPHEGYHILANWEKEGKIHFIATQNVDGFHKRAGSKEVHELHGSIYTARCNECQLPARGVDFLNGSSCQRCGGKLRPNVVLFGEMLPEEPWIKSMNAIQRSDLVIVIGTSLQVYPVNQLPQLTKGRVVFINEEDVHEDYEFDLIIRDKAGVVLQKINEMI